MEPAKVNEIPSKVQESLQETISRNVGNPETNIIDYIQKQVDSVSYEIDKIIGCKKDKNGELQYNVQWLAHTWIPGHILSPCFQFLIDRFSQENASNQTKLFQNNETMEMTEQVIEEGCSQPMAGEVEMASDSHEIQPESNKEEGVNEMVAEITTVNEEDEHPINLICPICQQSFFIKSDLDVHLLFCTKAHSSTQTIVESTSEIIETASGLNEPTSSIFEINTIKDALKLSQTFEYIPLTVPLECDSCNKRLPSGYSIGDIDMTNLLWNANKKTFGENVEVFECQECHRDYLYKHPVVSVDQEKIKVKEKPYKCSICNRSFELANEMYEHEVRHINTPNRYSCAKCNEKFNTRTALQEHYDSSENTCSPRKCNICLREFVHANHLKRHMSIHAGIKPYTCMICSHEFNQKSDLQRHQKRHTVKGRLACVKCALLYDSVEELREHILSHEQKNVEKSMFKCDKCTKTFGRKSHFKRHQSIHEGKKPHTCEECGKSFNQRTDLKRHQLTHERKKAKEEVKDMGHTPIGFCCEICQKIFPQAEILDAHKNVHQQIENTGLPY